MRTGGVAPTSLRAAAQSIWTHRHLIWEMSKREVVGRYRGSAIGLVWSFLNPLVMLLVYTFVFAVVFKARWAGSHSETKAEFAIVAFAGLIVYALVAESINRAPGLVTSNANYVKRVVFPLEILAVNALMASLFHAAVSFLVLIVANTALHGRFASVTVVAVPIIVAPLMLGTLGMAWILASLGAYVRDVGQTIGLVTTALMFLSPVFYPSDAVPGEFQTLIALNPLTFYIETFRDAVLWGKWPNWYALALHVSGAILVAAAGFWWFQKTRKGFADVV
jgi:lipopolysaccharide transport system permease protein